MQIQLRQKDKLEPLDLEEIAIDDEPTYDLVKGFKYNSSISA